MVVYFTEPKLHRVWAQIKEAPLFNIVIDSVIARISPHSSGPVVGLDVTITGEVHFASSKKAIEGLIHRRHVVDGTQNRMFRKPAQNVHGPVEKKPGHGREILESRQPRGRCPQTWIQLGRQEARRTPISDLAHNSRCAFECIARDRQPCLCSLVYPPILARKETRPEGRD
jgi:hypothetical protein